MNSTTVSAAGRELVKKFEGLHKVGQDGLVRAYRCPAGKWTIGWGHTKGVRSGQKITRDKAEEFLEADLADAVAIVNRYVTVPLSQFQTDTLGSFVFNLGEGNFRSSTLLKKLNRGDYQAVPSEIIRWNKATVDGKKVELAGLTRRRAAEAALWTMDTTFADDGGDKMPQKPEAAPVTQKPLKKSRTLAGLSVAGLGVILATVQEQITPFLGMIPYSEYVAAGLSIAGIVLAAYARVDDQLKALR